MHNQIHSKVSQIWHDSWTENTWDGLVYKRDKKKREHAFRLNIQGGAVVRDSAWGDLRRLKKLTTQHLFIYAALWCFVKSLFTDKKSENIKVLWVCFVPHFNPLGSNSALHFGWSRHPPSQCIQSQQTEIITFASEKHSENMWLVVFCSVRLISEEVSLSDTVYKIYV